MSTTKTCRACGSTNLIWGVIQDGRYFLYNKDGTIHECPIKPLPNLEELKELTFLEVISKRAAQRIRDDELAKQQKLEEYQRQYHENHDYFSRIRNQKR